jgi:hypothetical protein
MMIDLTEQDRQEALSFWAGLEQIPVEFTYNLRA